MQCTIADVLRSQPPPQIYVPHSHARHHHVYPFLSLAAPFLPRQTAPDVTFHVTSFAALMADPYIEGTQPNLAFHVSDTRPGFEAEVDCVIPPTYFNIHAISALFDNCGAENLEQRKLDFSYGFGERSLTVRRGWRVNE